MKKACRRRLGLFGGTFDPPHLGHLLAAQEAYERLALERVVLMPAFIRPHKSRPVRTPPEDRLEMLRLAAADDPRFEVSDLEIRRGGRSYTIDTVRALRSRFDGEVVLLLGSDSVRELPAWHRVGELVEMCTPVVLTRPGFAADDLAPLEAALSAEQVERIRAHLVPIPLIEISSSAVRARVAAGRPIRYLVPRAVEDYIRRRALYRAG